MAWTTMHFAVGMGCTGAAAGLVCFTLRRGWRWVAPAITAGGIFALTPDLPRFFREDFPGLPLASILGAKSLEKNLHNFGDLFFFHHALDAQPKEYALLGTALIILFYNMALAMMWYLEHKQRNSLANRAFQAHGELISQRPFRRRTRKYSHSHHHRSTRSKPDQAHPQDKPAKTDVIHRITPEDHSDAG